MYRWSMMKDIHSPNGVGIGSWGPEIWPHEYLISPIEIGVNWPGSKQLWTRPIYTDFSGANEVFMQPYLGLPWTNSCHIWCVRVFIMFYWNIVMKKLKCKVLMTSHFSTLWVCTRLADSKNGPNLAFIRIVPKVNIESMSWCANPERKWSIHSIFLSSYQEPFSLDCDCVELSYYELVSEKNYTIFIFLIAPKK